MTMPLINGPRMPGTGHGWVMGRGGGHWQGSVEQNVVLRFTIKNGKQRR